MLGTANTYVTLTCVSSNVHVDYKNQTGGTDFASSYKSRNNFYYGTAKEFQNYERQISI